MSNNIQQMDDSINSNFSVNNDFNPLGVNVAIKTSGELPIYQTEGAAGFDIAASETVSIPPHFKVTISTGIYLSIPRGFEIQIRPRSGVSLKTTLNVFLGTIDSDYRGEVRVIVENNSNEVVTLDKGFRIAQGVLCPVFRAIWQQVNELDDTVRSGNGFGSTGT